MSCVFAFPDGSQSFVAGFEAGMIWQEIEGEGKLIINRGIGEGFPVRIENMEVIRRMAACRNYSVETQPEKEGWVALRLAWVGEGGNKTKLSLVSGTNPK